MNQYITVQGDKWDFIAYKALGSEAWMDRLMAANTAYLDYYIFPAGIVLELPDVEGEQPSSIIMPPWKRVTG